MRSESLHGTLRAYGGVSLNNYIQLERSSTQTVPLRAKINILSSRNGVQFKNRYRFGVGEFSDQRVEEFIFTTGKFKKEIALSVPKHSENLVILFRYFYTIFKIHNILNYEHIRYINIAYSILLNASLIIVDVKVSCNFL